MDLSVVAAVGSFAISERVLKPKATALFFLGCILAYDLTTKTHDITSLRVYRGPALLAFTLMMCAYSLRTWRRNGIACDELLFLPGTLHGHEHGVEGPLIEMPEQHQSVSPSEQILSQQSSPNNNSHRQSQAIQRSASSPIRQSQPTKSEADLAAGGGAGPRRPSPPTFRQRRAHSEDEAGLLAIENSSSMEGESSSMQQEATGDSALNASDQPGSWDIEVEEEEGIGQIQGLLHRASTNDTSGAVDGSDLQQSSGSGIIHRWRENHPRLSRLGTFFFFRSSATSAQEDAAYAPSGPAVFGAGLDLSMPVLFNFHLFIEAYNHMQGPDGSDAPAKILPIIFLSVLIVRTVIPPSRRMRFWGTLKFAFTAPLHHVRFRDEFIGEVMTSWVRPGQDLFFALSYYSTVIWGTVSGKYGLTDSGLMLEESWLLHNVIMPSFAILPLWLKYLQTLRQAYDSNKRWPHQANSFKYLSATLVVIYAITHPENRTSPWWIASFAFALLYQIYWDVFVDWELFEIQPQIQLIDSESESWCARVSSFRPSSHTLLSLQMYIVQPLLDQYQRVRAAIPSWRQIQLRQKRLYKTEAFYWKIFAFNAVSRFTWMFCFIPAYHVSRSRTVLTSTSDVNSYWGVLLPVTEIVRRTLWGFLFVERETIKLMEADAKYARVAEAEDDLDSDEDGDADSKLGDRSFRSQLLPTWLDNQQQVAHSAATSRAKQRDHFMRQLFVVELYGWAAAFVF